MKKSPLAHVLILLFLAVLVAGCNSSNKKKSKEATVEVEVFDITKIKDQIVSTIRMMPKQSEVVDLLVKAEASYIFDLTVKPEVADLMLTAPRQAFAMGLYAFDMQYAQVYGRGDMAYQSGELSRAMVRKLGLEGELFSSEKYVDRIKNNAENKDSVNILVAQAMNFANQKLAQSEQTAVYAYAATGINIEALYVVTQLAQLAGNNEELLVVLTQQKERLNTLFSLLELMSGDENMKPVYEGIQPIVDLFNRSVSITAEQLAEISPAIEKVRNSLIQ